MTPTANKAVAELVSEALESAEAHRQAKRYDEASKVLIEALQHNQSSAQVYFRLGNVFFDQKLYDKAEYAYRRAIDFDDKHINAHHNLSVVYRKQGRLTESVKQRKKANKIARQNPQKVQFSDTQKQALRAFSKQVLLFGVGLIAVIILGLLLLASFAS